MVPVVSSYRFTERRKSGGGQIRVLVGVRFERFDNTRWRGEGRLSERKVMVGSITTHAPTIFSIALYLIVDTQVGWYLDTVQVGFGNHTLAPIDVVCSETSPHDLVGCRARKGLHGDDVVNLEEWIQLLGDPLT